MHPIDRRVAVERAMLDAAPHNLGEALAEQIRAQYGATSVELHLADYHQNTLEPALDESGPALPVVATAAGESFTRQEILRRADDGHPVLYLPVSVRGNRIGVLTVHTAVPLPAAEIDELAGLATALGHAFAAAETATDRFHRARRRQRLTLAAEMEWQLLPGRGLDGPEFRLAGQLEPAYSVRGDSFDWAVEDGRLTLSVTNGFGEGVAAALLTSLAVSALRNARRAGLPPAEQMAMADQAVWAYDNGAQHVSTLLLELDLSSGRVSAVDAGSPAVWLLRGTELRRLRLDQQLPLGMFDGTVYTAERFGLEPGDRLVLLSDGVVDANRNGRRYAEQGVPRVIRSTRLLPPAEVVRGMISDLLVFYGGGGLDDDAAVVCLDWLGKNGG
ncbi:PP2C family protein-serine/threonine phosphatase [Gandjariella thermophila]|uniref:Phosphatase n=1 Tax=Gandjariella thermophila TaxID=1931992 RepID=A0A4D4IWU0_9PSEU|nr:SpoIIE family protein phosphatase [Gandjariella thermophila]GDY28661.1 phosphatase [Gandjariella thermophila]